jgi:hypothetical protein
MMYKMKKDKRDSKMYGGGMKRKTAMGGGGMYGRKAAKHGGPHNKMDKMDRIQKAMGGAMDVLKPN